jgi:two-component sensor histidine kinase
VSGAPPPDENAKARLSACELLLAEYIHRTANDFAIASAEIHVASRMRAPSAVRDQLAQAATRLHALASIQRILLPPREASIDLGNCLCELCYYVAEARFAERESFIRLQTCEVVLDAERGWALLAIVSELLTNAARHAFHSPGGLVLVEVARRGDTILCRISDTGVGLAAAGREPRMGTAIVEALARGAGIDLLILPRDTGTAIELRLVVPATP